MGKPRGWTADEWSAYQLVVPGSTEWRLHVQILDRAHRLVSALPPVWSSAQTNIDVDQDVDRSAQLATIDIDGSLRQLLAPEVALRHYVRLRQGTWVPSLGRTLWSNAITGLPTTYSQQGLVYDITLTGKEYLWTTPQPSGSIIKGHYLISELRDWLTAAGEGLRLDLPPTSVCSARVKKTTKYGGTDDVEKSPWKVFKKAFAAQGWQLYVDGDGYYVVRPTPDAAAPVFTFDERTILTEPQLTIDLTTIRNRWIGHGGHGLTDSVDATGPFSAESLAVGETAAPWRALAYGSTNTSLSTKTKLIAAGKKALLKLVTYATQVQVDLVPHHGLDPLDMVGFKTPTDSTVVPVRQLSVPHAAEMEDSSTGDGWPMSFGSVDNVRAGSWGRSRITRHRKKKHK